MTPDQEVELLIRGLETAILLIKLLIFLTHSFFGFF